MSAKRKLVVTCGLWRQRGADESVTAEVPFYSASRREILFRKVKRKVRRMGGGGENDAFLLPTSKTYLMLKLTVPHPPTSSTVPTCLGEKTPLKTTSKSEGCLYTLSD